MMWYIEHALIHSSSTCAWMWYMFDWNIAHFTSEYGTLAVNFFCCDYAWACYAPKLPCCFYFFFVIDIHILTHCLNNFRPQFDAHMIHASCESNNKNHLQFSRLSWCARRNHEERMGEAGKKNCKRKYKLSTAWNSLLLSVLRLSYTIKVKYVSHTHTHTRWQCYWIVLSMFHTIFTSSTIFANHFATSTAISCSLQISSMLSPS